VKNIDVGKIVISPYEFKIIQEIRIEKKLNEHETLYVRGIISDEEQIAPVTNADDSTTITCENDGIIYFKGVLRNVKIASVESVFQLEIFAISNTILLDTIKHNRSFQDNDQTYQSIIESIIEGSMTYNAPEMTVENIILQYNETDWEFAKRLASHTQDVLIPITADEPSFHFGATNEGSATLTTNNFLISKDIDVFRRMSKEEKSLSAEDVTVVSVVADEFLCELGDKFTFNGMDLRVYGISLSYIDAALAVTYTLVPQKAISAPKHYNKAITGLVLDGTVMEVENDTLKLKLDDDAERGVELDTAEEHFFKYATDYSMETHTGWYVMPEEGDTVQLFFPKEDEKYAYATSAIRRDDTDKTTDHLVKYLRTSFGKEIKFDKNEILISSLDDTTFICINEDEKKGITITTPHPVLIHSGSTLTMTSDDDMTITTEKNLYIEAKDSIKMVNAGNNMSFIPADGINVATDKKLSVSSDDDTSIDSTTKVSMSSGDDMNISSGSILFESAERVIEISCSDSSIKMDGNIDIAAKLIKQN